jgi:hypothetical protein
VAAHKAAQTVHDSPRLPDVRNLPRGGLRDIRRARVYFIEGAGLVKIGVATDVGARFRGLCNSCPVPLTLLGHCAGTLDDEAEWHRRFAHLRRHGEWFEPAPELLAEIDRLGPCTQILNRP